MDDLARRLEAARLMDAYSYNPDFIEQQYQVPAVGELLAGEGVIGVVRLIELLSFCSERLHTFVYTSEYVVVSTVKGATSLWYSIPQFTYIDDSPDLTELETEPFIAEQAKRRSTTLPLSMPRVSPLVSNWTALATAASAAPSCATDTFDGVSYRHRVRARDLLIDADWHNPRQPQHAPQVHLVVAYTQLLDLADLFPEEREEAERRRFRNRENRLARKKRKEERRKRR